MRLTTVETSIIREAEEMRTRALSYLERGSDLVILSQLVREAAESYDHAAALIALRAKAESKARAPALHPCPDPGARAASILGQLWRSYSAHLGCSRASAEYNSTSWGCLSIP
jgi:hypothetical protein